MLVRIYRDSDNTVHVKGNPNKNSSFYKFVLDKITSGIYLYVEWDDSVFTPYFGYPQY